MDPALNPLLPQTAEIIVGALMLLTLVGGLAALIREGRRGGNVAGWLLAFLVGGPITLVVYGATQFQEPARRV